MLPTKIEGTPKANGVAFAFDYDDGPGKRVTGRQRWQIEGQELRAVSGNRSERFRIAEQRSTGPGDLTLVFDGKGRENDAPVMVRTIVARRGETLSITRMTRAPSAPFLMRHAYWLKAAP